MEDKEQQSEKYEDNLCTAVTPHLCYISLPLLSPGSPVINLPRPSQMTSCLSTGSQLLRTPHNWNALAGVLHDSSSDNKEIPTSKNTPLQIKVLFEMLHK